MWEYNRYFFEGTTYELSNNKILEINDFSSKSISYIDITKHLIGKPYMNMLYVDKQHIYIFIKNTLNKKYIIIINKKSHTYNRVFVKKIRILDINRLVILEDFIYNFYKDGVYIYDKTNFQLIEHIYYTKYKYAMNKNTIFIFNQNNTIKDKIPVLSIKEFLEQKLDSDKMKPYVYKQYMDRYNTLSDSYKNVQFEDDINKISSYRNKLKSYRDKLMQLHVKSNPISWSKYEIRDYFKSKGHVSFSNAIFNKNLTGSDILTIKPIDIKILTKETEVSSLLLKEIAKLNSKNKIQTGMCYICGDKKSNIVFRNCKHIAVCDECSLDLDECVVCSCRLDEEDKIKIFI